MLIINYKIKAFTLDLNKTFIQLEILIMQGIQVHTKENIKNQVLKGILSK